MGSVAPWLDFSSGWDPSLPDQISFWGGIHCLQTKFLFGVRSWFFYKIYFLFHWSIHLFCIHNFSFEKNPSIYCLTFFLFNVFTMPQVFEQSLFLFKSVWEIMYLVKKCFCITLPCSTSSCQLFLFTGRKTETCPDVEANGVHSLMQNPPQKLADPLLLGRQLWKGTLS